MVLGHPEAMEAERLDVLSEVDGVAQRLRRRGACGDGRLVEHGEAKGIAHGDWMSGGCVKTQRKGALGPGGRSLRGFSALRMVRSLVGTLVGTGVAQ